MTVKRFATPAEWELGRRIGSSDVAAVLGRSPYPDATPFTVWERLVGRRRKPGSTGVQQRGHALEPTVLQAYADREEIDLEVPAPLTTFFRETHSSSTPDARVPGGPLVEAKTSTSRAGWGPDGVVLEQWERGVIPAHYYLQVQHQAWVLGVDTVDVAALFPAREPFGPHELRVYTVHANEGVQARMVERLAEWWQRHVIERRPPPLDGSAAAGRWLARIEPDGTRREATQAEAMLAMQHAYAAAAAKQWKERRDMLGSLLAGALGTAERLDLPGGYVRLIRNRGRDVVNVERLLEDHPELRQVVAKYTRHTDAYAYPAVRLNQARR